MPSVSTDLEEAIAHPDTDTVVIGLPNHLHLEALELCARARQGGPLHEAARAERRGGEAHARHRRGGAGSSPGTSRTSSTRRRRSRPSQAVRAGQIGQVTWARSRETHPGPHSAWFWDAEQAGGGAIVDLGCHCIEIVRSYMGKENRPLEVMAWTDTLVHPIEAEDNAICLIRFESGAIGQFEVSWTFRGGMDLRDEVAGTEGTIWTNHFLRTGFEMFSSGEGAGYVAEKAESASGWLFPVGDEVAELGYVDMFTDMFDALDEGRAPTETFYDGYVVNSVMDACYASAASRQWEPVRLDDWRGGGVEPITRTKREHDGRTVIKEEQMPDGRRKLILKDEATGAFSDVVV